MTCKECGAKVARKKKAKHKRWHRGLDLLLDFDDDFIDMVADRLVGQGGLLVGPPGPPGPSGVSFPPPLGLTPIPSPPWTPSWYNNDTIWFDTYRLPKRDEADDDR